MPELRELAAYHEAGHAVVAWTQSLTIYSVSIDANQREAGYVLHQDGLHSGDLVFSPRSGRARLGAERNIRVALAGAIAQRFFAPASLNEKHNSNDRAAVETLLEALHGEANRNLIDAHHRLLEIETELLVSKNWPIIEAVASELIRHKQLTGARVSGIILAINSRWRLSSAI